MKRLVLVSLFVSSVSACDVPPEEEASALEPQALRYISQEQLIDFDSATYRSPLLGPVTVYFGDGEQVDGLYAHLGVNFSCVACTSGHAYARRRGASNGVSLFPAPLSGPYGGAFDARFGAVEATFDTARAWASIEATAVASLEGLGTPTARPWLEGYDAAGNLVSRAYHSGAVGAREVLTVSGSIKRVRFSSQYHGAGVPPLYGAFDNLRFNVEWLPIVRSW